MKNRALVFTSLVALVAVAACSSDTEPVVSKLVTFKATMIAANEVPAVTVASTGTGTFTGVLDTSTNIFTYDITFSGLTSNVNNGHIHGPAAAAVAASPLINFNT